MGFLTGPSSAGVLRWRRIRKRWILLDRDVAKILNSTPKELNRSVRRRPASFPADFAFLLTADEWQKKFPRWEGGRRGTRLPWAYSVEGILQLKVARSGDQQLDLIRWLALCLRQLQFTPPAEAWLMVPPAAARGNSVEDFGPQAW